MNIKNVLFTIQELNNATKSINKGISISGRNVTNLRYADDTTLIAGTKDDFTELITKVKSKLRSRGISKCQENNGDVYR